MSLTKPILNPVVAWDVANGQTFTFNVIGGDAVVNNILTIIDNDSGTVVYTTASSEPTYRFEAIVPANASGLTNGTQYSAYVQTINALNETSVPSNTILFYCYSTPSWHISNITEGSTVTNASIAPQAQYSQSEGEALNDYTFTLYDSNHLQLSTSGVIYTGSSSSSIVVSYDFFGLEDDTAYYIRAVGHTAEGTSLDTGYIRFVTDYIRPVTYSILTLENNCDEGYIVYSSTAIDIEGISYPSPPTYTMDGVDLTSLGSYVVWNEGFDISDSFTLKAWIKNPTLGENLIYLHNSNEQEKLNISCIIHPYDNTKIIAILTASSISLKYSYTIYSNAIDIPASNDLLCIQARRINSIYELSLEVVT